MPPANSSSSSNSNNIFMNKPGTATYTIPYGIDCPSNYWATATTIEYNRPAFIPIPDLPTATTTTASATATSTNAPATTDVNSYSNSTFGFNPDQL
jgi:hypothetical protein